MVERTDLGVELGVVEDILRLEVAMPSQREQIVDSICLDLYLKPLDSGRLQHKSREWKQAI